MLGIAALDVAVGVAFERAQAVAADLQAAHRLLQRLLEGAADRHRLAHRLHLRAEHAIHAGELLEGPARELDHHVVDRRLEGGHGALRDVVAQFVQRVAHGHLGGQLGDGEAGGLGGQR